MTTRNADWLSQYRQGGKLPSPKGVYLEALRLLEQEEVDSRELVRVLQSDPATNARLLQLANVSIRTRSRPIVAVADAILVLGQAQIKRLILALALLQSTTPRVAGFDYPHFWTRALLAALATQALAEHLGQVNADEIFVVALLAKVGELALVSLFTESYVELAAPLEGCNDIEVRLQAERQQYGIDQDELSSLLVEEWGLPVVFVEAVFHQSHPQALSTFPDASRPLYLARLLRLGQGMAGMCLLDNPERVEDVQRLAVEAQALGVDDLLLQEQLSRLMVNWEHWQDLLQEAAPLLSEPLDWKSLAVEREVSSDDVSKLSVLCLGEQADLPPECLNLLSFLEMPAVSVHNGLDLLLVAYHPQHAEQIKDLLAGLDAVFGPYLLLYGEALDAQSEALLFRLGVDAYECTPLRCEALQKHLQRAYRRREARQKYAQRQQRMRRFTGSLAEINRDLRQAALTDPLTSLRNRRYADERLRQEWTLAQRQEKNLALMLLDLDNFKSINDSLGHAGGDEVLRRVASVLRDFARHQDVPCRIGGDEFSILCPETDLQGVEVLAQRICARLAAAETWTGLEHVISVSIGVASRDAQMQSSDDLLQAADHALFEAKRQGRNQVVCFSRP